MSFRFEYYTVLLRTWRAPALPSSTAAPLETERGRKRRLGQLRRQCALGGAGAVRGLCPDSGSRREQAPKSQSLSAATELCCFWFVNLLENKRHYHLWMWEITDRTLFFFP